MTPFEIIQYAAAIFVDVCFLSLAASVVYSVAKAFKKK
jgi:hypothetical protein